jgi:hypothetical protein
VSETISPNTTIAQCTIVSKIGEGGMGEVYHARDTKLGRDVAIKVLPSSLSENIDRLNRFEQEAQAAGALNHPNILSIYHIGTHQGAPYIVSELLEGETLRDRLAGGALPQRKATDCALQIVVRQFSRIRCLSGRSAIPDRNTNWRTNWTTADRDTKLDRFGEEVNENLASS